MNSPSRSNNSGAHHPAPLAVVSRDPGALRSLGALHDPFAVAQLTTPSNTGAAVVPSLISMFSHYRWTVLLVTAAVVAPSVWAIVAFFVPQYRASAEVRVSPVIPRIVHRVDENGPIPLYNQYLNTQISVIGSPTVLRRVLESPEVRSTTWYRERPKSLLGKTESHLDRLRDGLEIVARGGTEIIDVRFIAPVPEDAATIVNAILDEYIRFALENQEHTNDLVYRELMEQYDALRAAIEKLEVTVAKTRAELGTGAPQDLFSQRRARLEEAEARLADREREIKLVEWQIGEAEAIQPRVGDDPAAPRTTQNLRYQSDADWRKFYLDMRTAQYRLETEGQRLGESNPTLASLRKSVQLAEDMLRTREAQLDEAAQLPAILSATAPPGVSAANEVDVLRKRLKQLKYEQDLLASGVEEQRATVRRTGELVQILTRENDALQYKRELFRAVELRRDQKEMERGAPGSLQIQSQAFPPSEPSNQKKQLMMIALAVFGGTCAGLAAGYIRGTMCRSVQHAGEVMARARTQCLGHMPLERRLPAKIGPAVREEHIRMIRTALLQRLEQGHTSCVMVSSAGAGAGKTAVSLALARSLAKAGKNTLLVDADLRRPTIAACIGIESRPNLRDWLTRADAEIQSDRLPRVAGVAVLPGGRSAAGDEAELLGSPRMLELFDRWRREFDIVILDSAPVLPVADTRILASRVDAVIMVVREGHCGREDVVEALEDLRSSGGHVLGMVYVGSGPHGAYRRSYYQHYYTSEYVAPGLDAHVAGGGP